MSGEADAPDALKPPSDEPPDDLAIQQISTVQLPSGRPALFALCADGSLWSLEFGHRLEDFGHWHLVRGATAGSAERGAQFVVTRVPPDSG